MTVMDVCNPVRFHFINTKADGCEKVSNCLLKPLRAGLGCRIWDEKANALTSKVARIGMAILAFTLWLLPTLIGLTLWKFSKTHPQHYQTQQKIQAQQAMVLPVIPVTSSPSFEMAKSPKITPIFPSSTPTISSPTVIAEDPIALPSETQSPSLVLQTLIPITQTPTPVVPSLIPVITSTVSLNAVQASIPNVGSAPYKQLRDLVKKVEELHDRLEVITQQDKDDWRIDLEAAYAQTIGELKAQPNVTIPVLMILLSRILYLEAKRSWMGNLEDVLILFQGALLLRITSMDFHAFEKAFGNIFTFNSSLASLRKSSAQSNHPFEAIMKIFSDSTPDDSIKKIIELSKFTLSGDKDLVMNVAAIINRIGSICMKLKKYQKDFNLLENLFEVAKGLYNSLKTTDSKWRLINMNFTTGRDFHLLKRPGDVKGALGTLDEINLYLVEEGKTLRAEKMRIEILEDNVARRAGLFATLPLPEYVEELKKNFEDTCQAVQIIESMPSYEKEHKWHLWGERISLAMSCFKEKQKVVNGKEIGIWINALLKEIHKDDYKCERSIKYLLLAATYKILSKPRNIPNALNFYNLALKTYDKFKGTSTRYEKDLEKFKVNYGKILGLP